MTEGVGVALGIVFLLLAGIIFLVGLRTGKSDKARKDIESFDAKKFASEIKKESSGLKGSLAPKSLSQEMWQEMRVSDPGAKNDSHHGGEEGRRMWVCPICETLNEGETAQCIVCGGVWETTGDGSNRRVYVLHKLR